MDYFGTLQPNIMHHKPQLVSNLHYDYLNEYPYGIQPPNSAYLKLTQFSYTPEDNESGIILVTLQEFLAGTGISDYNDGRDIGITSYNDSSGVDFTAEYYYKRSGSTVYVKENVGINWIAPTYGTFPINLLQASGTDIVSTSTAITGGIGLSFSGGSAPYTTTGWIRYGFKCDVKKIFS